MWWGFLLFSDSPVSLLTSLGFERGAPNIVYGRAKGKRDSFQVKTVSLSVSRWKSLKSWLIMNSADPRLTEQTGP